MKSYLAYYYFKILHLYKPAARRKSDFAYYYLKYFTYTNQLQGEKVILPIII